MIEHILTLTILIIAVIILRGLFGKRISKRFLYAMWLVVALKLLIPVPMISNSYHVMNLIYSVAEQNQSGSINVENIKQNFGEGNEEKESYVDGSQLENSIVQQGAERTKDNEAKRGYSEWVFWIIWLLGAGVCGSTILASNLIFSISLRKNRRRLEKEEGMEIAGKIPVYCTEQIATPCLFGLFSPAIYVTEECLKLEQFGEVEDGMQCILAHEMTHYRHRDFIWAVVRCLCVIFYWYHPLVWIAAKLSMEDSEMACDEGALQWLGNDKRMAYGEMLIAMGTGSFQRRNLLACATGIASGKRELKHRLYGIVGKKSNKKSAFIMIGILLLGITGCTFGSPAKQETSKATVEKEEEYSNDSVVIIKDGIFQQGSEDWETFKGKCQSQAVDAEHPVSITIKEQYEDEPQASKVVSYDGERYSCDGRRWKYLLDVTGKSGNPERESRMVVLANATYEYDELVWSMFSSSSSDNIEFDWLFWTHGDLTENEEPNKSLLNISGRGLVI